MKKNDREGLLVHRAKLVRFPFALFALVIFVARADATILTSANCSADGSSTSGVFACSVTSPEMGRASATVHPITITFSGTSFSASEGVDAFAWQSPSPPDRCCSGGPAEASAFSDILLDLTTSGAQRPGFMKVNWEGSVGRPYDGPAHAILSVGPWILQDGANPPFGNCCSILIPIELGLPFAFEMSATVDAMAFGFDGLSGGNASDKLAMQFLETDGITPVAIYEASSVPEPRSFCLALGCVALLLILRYGRPSC
jgi:hypothetical protein